MVGSRGSTGSSLTTFATHKTFLFEYFISNFCLSLDCLQLCFDLILGHLINESNNKKAVNVGQSCVRPLIVWRIGKKLMEIVDYIYPKPPSYFKQTDGMAFIFLSLYHRCYNFYNLDHTYSIVVLGLIPSPNLNDMNMASVLEYVPLIVKLCPKFYSH